MTTAEFVERSRSKFGDRFGYLGTIYHGYTQPIHLSCRQHGPIATTPKLHLHSLYGCCRACTPRGRSQPGMTTDDFIRRAREVHGDGYDYRDTNYHRSNRKVIIYCPLHGPFHKTPDKHLAGQGCRHCSHARIGRERQLSVAVLMERFADVHGSDRYVYNLANYLNFHSKIDIVCRKHGPFQQSVGAHLQGHGCARCSSSRGEARVRAVLKRLDVEFCEQMRFRQCRDRSMLPFDFYVPSQRTLIEYDGKQHFQKSKLWGGHHRLEFTQRHDALRNAFASQHGYRLIRIPYWRYREIEVILRDALLPTTSSLAA